MAAIIIGASGAIVGIAILAIMDFIIITLMRQFGQALLFFPISYLEDIIVPLMILIPLMFLPGGLIEERRKPIKGIVYGEI